MRSYIENVLVYKKILLPFYPHLPLEILLSIIDRETDAFERFKFFLRKRITAIAEVKKSIDFTELNDEIDYEVSRLSIEAKKVGKLKILQGFNTGFFSISLLALLIPGMNIPPEISGIVGATSFLSLLKDLHEIQSKKLDLRKSDFYIPFLLHSCNSD